MLPCIETRPWSVFTLRLPQNLPNTSNVDGDREASCETRTRAAEEGLMVGAYLTENPRGEAAVRAGMVSAEQYGPAAHCRRSVNPKDLVWGVDWLKYIRKAPLGGAVGTIVAAPPQYHQCPSTPPHPVGRRGRVASARRVSGRRSAIPSACNPAVDLGGEPRHTHPPRPCRDASLRLGGSGWTRAYAWCTPPLRGRSCQSLST